uniref:Uncharacterized protein n=1 Tax=Anopheles culicifacies TaxID=139723 RepID=A0A182LYK7_9DIPT
MYNVPLWNPEKITDEVTEAVDGRRKENVTDSEKLEAGKKHNPPSWVERLGGGLKNGAGLKRQDRGSNSSRAGPSYVLLTILLRVTSKYGSQKWKAKTSRGCRAIKEEEEEQ